MKRKNATRNALFTSILSLMLCVSMLVGTTFAWFTDTASSGLNQIIAGNLDVELLYKNGSTYENAADVELFDDIELWEPGMVAYETVKIANVGNLALKYALSINTGNENTLNGHDLSEVLHFAVIKGDVLPGTTRTEMLAMAEASADKGMLTSYVFNNEFSLEKETESDPMTLVVYWPASTNEFDNLFNANNGQTTSDGKALHIDLGLTVFASQETVEEDSFDKWYDDTASYPENMWLGDVAEVLVIDEETKTISISSGAELAKLAEVVNAGTHFDGYTVKLTDSIDLNNIAWTAIGAEGNALKADVDGQGNTIYNLNVSGKEYVGLFGQVYTANVTNVHVINATVNGNHFLGAVAGAVDYGNVTNCSVKNAKIVATPNGSEDAYDNGDKVGGVVGRMTEGSYTLSDNKAENVYLKAYRDVGGIIGMAHNNNTLKENEAKEIQIVVDQATNAYGDKDFNAGGIVGRVGTNVAIDDSNTETKVEISYIVATETALRNAIAKGGSVTLGADIAVDADDTINVANSVVLDLNGYTLSGVSNETGKNKSLIVVTKGGDLTVKNGTVTMEHTGANMGWNNSTNALEAVSGGKLTLENVYVKNLGGSDMAYAVNVGNNGGATLKTINATIESVNYNAMRVFNNADGAINIDLTEGTVLTGSGSPFFVNFWTKDDLGEKQATRQAYLNVNFNDTQVTRYSGSKSLLRYGFTNAIYYSNTELTEVVAGSEVALTEALENGEDVALNNDFNDFPVNTKAPYGNYYGIAQNGGVLDGNGKTLDFDLGELNNGKADNYGIMTSGGTIKNVTITGVFRGIMIMNPTEDIIIDNVTIGDEDVCYAINTGEGNGTHDLIVTNSTIKGWSSYGTAIKSVSFTNCTFAQGEYYDNVFGRLVKPYVDTVFENCEFNSKFYIDLSQLGKDGDGKVLNQDAKITLKNCTVNGVKLTADNWTQLIASEADCGEGQISIEAKDGSYMTASIVLDYVIIQ